MLAGPRRTVRRGSPPAGLTHLWCERVVIAYARGSYDDEYPVDVVVEWLQDEHPIVYAAMLAGWRYPDGERLPLPFPPP